MGAVGGGHQRGRIAGAAGLLDRRNLLAGDAAGGSARSGDVETYAFQLDVYALAARSLFPEAKRLRAGLVFLGGGNQVKLVVP